MVGAADPPAAPYSAKQTASAGDAKPTTLWLLPLLGAHSLRSPVLVCFPHRTRLQKMILTMRERLSAKMGNQNNNAFKFRKLFQM